MARLFPLVWCGILMALCVTQMLHLNAGGALFHLPQTVFDGLVLALFCSFGLVAVLSFLGVFLRRMLWGCLFVGVVQIALYLALAGRQDTPEYAVPTFLTLVACAITWAAVRAPGPSAWNIAEES